jgi:lipoyl-dependent peroxiredoxin
MNTLNATTHAKRVLYTAKVHTSGGRDGGASRRSDGRLDIKHSLPGSQNPGTSPEQLFAAGCLHALRAQ